MIIRVMGEIEIHCFEQKGETASADKLSALTSIDSQARGILLTGLARHWMMRAPHRWKRMQAGASR